MAVHGMTLEASLSFLSMCPEVVAAILRAMLAAVLAQAIMALNSATLVVRMLVSR